MDGVEGQLCQTAENNLTTPLKLSAVQTDTGFPPSLVRYVASPQTLQSSALKVEEHAARAPVLVKVAGTRRGQPQRLIL